MKLLGVSILLVMIFTASSFAQSEARRVDDNPADLAVTDLQVEDINIIHVLSRIAYQFHVPISLEIATNEDLHKSVKVQVKKGTLADVLDSIVKEDPSYTWDANESTIRVFPKTEFRDPLLQQLLEIRISHFVVPKRIAKLNFREALTNRAELKKLLKSYGVRPSNEAFSFYDMQPFEGDSSLNLKSVAVRSILNHLIKNTKNKYWIIRREGDTFSVYFPGGGRFIKPKWN